MHAEAPVEREEPTDLLGALRASVQEHSRKKRANDPRDGNLLSSLSKDELAKRAKKAGIPNRSTMTKDELVDALASR